MSKPENYFKASISRSFALIEEAKKQSGAMQDDVNRAAVVIAVAAYDHYFTSKFCDVLSSFLHKHNPNKELIELLERAGLKTATALELMVMDRPFRRVRSLLAKSLSEKTTNRTKAIDNLFSAIELKGLSGRVRLCCTNWSEAVLPLSPDGLSPWPQSLGCQEL